MVTRTIVLGPEFDHLEDDQGETLGNASYHQDVAIAARECLRVYGQRRGLPWYVSYQTPLAKNGVVFTPDVFVHPTRGSDPFDVLDVEREGPPALIIEVLNPVTGLATDLNPLGKLGSYAAMGVAEYLTFDPIGEIVPEQVRAWRLGPDDTYVPWVPTATWRWQSALGIAFAPQGLRLRVFDETGVLIPDVDDRDEGFDQQARELAAAREQRLIQERMLTEETSRRMASERELAALRAELARLRDKA